MSGLLLDGGVRQRNLNVSDAVWSRSGLRKRGEERLKSLSAHASVWSEDGSCSEEEDGLEVAGSRGAWGSSGGRGSESSDTQDSVEEEEGEGRAGEREGEREEHEVELLVYAELTSIRDKLKEQLRLLSEEGSQVQTLGREIREREKSLKEREEVLNQSEAALRHREEMLATQEREVTEREAAVVGKEGELGCREQKVVEMERLACEVHESLTCCIGGGMSARLETEQREEEVGRLQGCLKEKSRETQRLKRLCEATKQANASLKSQLQEAKEKNSKLETQLSSTAGRLGSLQRRNDQLVSRLQQLQTMSEPPVSGLESGWLPVRETKKGGSGQRSFSSQPGAPMYSDLLGTVMEWLCSVHLSQPLAPEQLAEVQRSSSKVLPSVASLLPLVPSHSDGLQLPLLQFVFWCVMHLSAKQKKSTLTSTLRRIGEAVYRPMTPCADTEEGSQQQVFTARAFFRSHDCHTRTLSCLLVLQTLTQVDCLAQVFEQLKQDLKEDLGKGVFLVYRGVQIVLPFMTTANRVLCSHALDAYLLLSMESDVLPHFLAACSTDQWFSACAALLREGRHTDTAMLEKLSILLQRLSKIKSNRHLFENHQLVGVVEEVLRTQAGCESSFLSLNLQSTLLNLDHRH